MADVNFHSRPVLQSSVAGRLRITGFQQMKISRYPSPIILGKKRPSLRFENIGTNRVTYSISNHNLFFEPHHFDKDGTLPISSLLGARASSYGVAENYQLPACNDCLWGNKVCPMLVKGVHHTPYSPDLAAKDALRVYHLELWDSPQLDKCPCLSALLNEVQSEAEDILFRTHYEMAITGVDSGHGKHGEVLEVMYTKHQNYRTFVSEWEKQQSLLPADHRSPGRITAAILRSLSTPALLPQYWVHWTYDPTVPPADKHPTTVDIPSRVDFVLFFKGDRHIVEIDDPSHYARFDDIKKQYIADEVRYTTNLRIERNLRSQGWEIHRLSNWEVLNELSDAYTGLERDIQWVQALPEGPEPRIPGLQVDFGWYRWRHSL